MTDIFVYDNENGISSKFYQSIKRFYPNFESQAFEKKWVVAIPLSKSFDSDKITKQYINAHIFQPSSFYLGQYVSLVGKQAEIKSNFLLISKRTDYDSNPQIERSCRILEDNEVYNEHLSSQSYRILLIDKPVEGTYNAINPSQTGISALHRKSIDEIVSYLVNDEKATTVVNSLRSNIHYLVNGYTVDPRVDTIDYLYHRILHLINSHYEMMVQTNPEWYCCRQSREKEMILRCCIETFVMEEIYPMLYPLIQKKTERDDAVLSEYITFIQSQGGFTREELNLKPLMFQPAQLQQAIHIVNQLANSHCVLRKLRIIWECLRSINRSISDFIQLHYNKNVDLAADDIVPLTVLVLSSTSITDFLAINEYIMTFDYTELKDRDLGFCFVTFQVAVTFLKEKSIEWKRNHRLSQIHSTSVFQFLTPQQESIIKRESDKSTRRLRRGTIAYNPKQMTYRNENTVPSLGLNNMNDSVFSQILVRDFLNEEAHSPELIRPPAASTETTPEGENYWWNSKANRKRRITLPWNYSASPDSATNSTPSERKASSPLFTGRLPSSPRGFHRKASSPRPSVSFGEIPHEKACLVALPPPAETSKRRYFCWCCGEEEEVEENQPTSVLQPYQEIQIEKPMKRTTGQTGVSLGLSSTLPLPATQDMSANSTPSRLTRSSIFTFDGDLEREVSPMDPGMGSFIRDLKKSSSHCVSSRSWNSSAQSSVQPCL